MGKLYANSRSAWSWRSRRSLGSFRSLRSCFTPWSTWTWITCVTFGTDWTDWARQAYISFGTLRTDGACITLVAFGTLKSNFTTRSLWTHHAGITLIAFRTLRTSHALRPLRPHRPNITFQTLGTNRTNFTARTLCALRSGVALRTLWTCGTRIPHIALVTFIAFITFGTCFTAWTLHAAITLITLIAFITFRSLRAGIALRSCIPHITLGSHRTGRTDHSTLAFRPLQTHATIMERCEEGDDLFLSSILQMKEHRTRGTGQKFFRQLHLLAEHGHEVATIVHHNLVTFRAPQNFFRGFIEDGNFKPVEHRTDIRLARAVAVGFDVNVGRIIVIVGGRMRIVLSRIILSWILPWILIISTRILSGCFVLAAGIRCSAGSCVSRFALFARSWRRTGIQNLGVGILSLDHNRCRSPFDLFLLNPAAHEQQGEGKSRPGAREVHFHWMFHWSPLL